MCSSMRRLFFARGASPAGHAQTAVRYGAARDQLKGFPAQAERKACTGTLLSPPLTLPSPQPRVPLAFGDCLILDLSMNYTRRFGGCTFQTTTTRETAG